MNLDLTGLAEIDRPGAGEPLMVPLNVISCDPTQPRRRIDEPALHELAESIRAIGVVQPISLRPDPSADGRYIINYGERRYRAAVIAGLTAIPALVHKAPGSYTQVAENLHRADLSPMEIALFIQRRLDDGEKKQEIAAKLGYKKSYVTEHLALLESPVCVEKAYANGVASARTLYDLRRLHEEFPRQVDAWIASGAEVTRESIVAFGQKVRHDELTRDVTTVSEASNRVDDDRPTTPRTAAPGVEVVAVDAWITSGAEVTREAIVALGQKVRHDELARDATTGSMPSNTVDNDGPTTPLTAAPAVKVDASSPFSQPNHRTHADAAAEVKPPMRKMRIKVNYGGRSAVIDDDSVVRLRYEDGGMAEVRLADTVVVATVAA